MDLITSVFEKPLPLWISNIKSEARVKIACTSFTQRCRAGDHAVMRGLVVGLWPFVDQFPKSLVRGAARLGRTGTLNNRELLNTLLHRGSEILAGIRRDEKNHRRLWLQTGVALGLRFPSDFNGFPLTETKAWICAVSADVDPCTAFLRFAAIEMIAEAISVEVLSSSIFVSELGERGCEWFRVHAEHGSGMGHEELELRLAFAMGDTEPRESQVRNTIHEIVDKFLLAAEASAAIAEIQQTQHQ